MTPRTAQLTYLAMRFALIVVWATSAAAAAGAGRAALTFSSALISWTFAITTPVLLPKGWQTWLLS